MKRVSGAQGPTIQVMRVQVRNPTHPLFADICFFALPMSAFVVAIGDKADMGWCAAQVRL